MRHTKPLKRRGEALRLAVLNATVDEIAEHGIDKATVASVAARAGVHETSIYRRFGGRTDLLLAALLDRTAQSIDVPDTGALRTDLIALARSIGDYLQSPIGSAMLRSAVSVEAPADDRDAFWDHRLATLHPVIDRAKQRGELSRDADGRLILEALVGPLHSRALLTHRRIDDDFSERLADLVLNGCRGADRR